MEGGLKFEVLDKYRHKTGIWGTRDGDKFGLFFIPRVNNEIPLKVICSHMGENEWEHVSVSLPNRCPSWDEMCKVKDLFWGDDVTVIQFHPKKSEYVSNHPYCLHLWRKTNVDHETPPSLLVGIK